MVSMTDRTACPVPFWWSWMTIVASAAWLSACAPTWSRAWPTTTTRRSGSRSRAVAMACPSMLRPHNGCSTFGRVDFIRVPSPAARTMTAAGRLALTPQGSSDRCRYDGAVTCLFTCPSLGGYRQVAEPGPHSLRQGEGDVGLPGPAVARGERGHTGPVAARDQRVPARRNVAEREAPVLADGGGGDLGTDLIGQRDLGAGEGRVTVGGQHRADHAAGRGQLHVVLGQLAFFHRDLLGQRGVGGRRHDQGVLALGQLAEAVRAVGPGGHRAGDLAPGVGHGHGGVPDRLAGAAGPDRAGQAAATPQHDVVAGGWCPGADTMTRYDPAPGAARVYCPAVSVWATATWRPDMSARVTAAPGMDPPSAVRTRPLTGTCSNCSTELIPRAPYRVAMSDRAGRRRPRPQRVPGSAPRAHQARAAPRTGAGSCRRPGPPPRWPRRWSPRRRPTPARGRRPPARARHRPGRSAGTSRRRRWSRWPRSRHCCWRR